MHMVTVTAYTTSHRIKVVYHYYTAPTDEEPIKALEPQVIVSLFLSPQEANEFIQQTESLILQLRQALQEFPQ